MVLGIDASNIRVGGGVTHLVQFLAAAEPDRHGFDEVIVWAPSSTLAQLPERAWLRCEANPALDHGPAARLLWRCRRLPVAAARCQLLFVPGGLPGVGECPYVTLSQNLLPFEPDEMARYFGTLIGVRLLVLRHAQIGAFRRAAGTIFLTDYARETVTRWTGPLARTSIIPHGIDAAFKASPLEQRPIASYDHAEPFRFLYVSVVDLYKHHIAVAAAVAALRADGLPLAVDFVGPAYPPALATLQRAMKRLDPDGTAVQYRGPAAFADLPAVYRNADAFVFASTCENMPNVLVEAMAAGLPIACSSHGPMPEVLGSAGLYFDPLDAASTRDTLRRLVADETLRATIAARAFERAERYSWQRCADETFDFLRDALPGAPERAQRVT